jgi:CheY-like chemotaxis protein
MKSPWLRVLVVDDETLITFLIEEMLADLDCHMVGPAYELSAALEMARGAEFDCAILDFNLAGKATGEVADVLRVRGLPFAVASGYAGLDFGPAFEAAPVLQKPFDSDHLTTVIKQLAGAIHRPPGPFDPGSRRQDG